MSSSQHHNLSGKETDIDLRKGGHSQELVQDPQKFNPNANWNQNIQGMTENTSKYDKNYDERKNKDRLKDKDKDKDKNQEHDPAQVQKREENIPSRHEQVQEKKNQ